MALRRLGSSQIAADAITTPKLAAGAVTNPKIGASAVGAAELASDAVTEPKIASDAVTGPKIAANAVTQPKIANDAVGAAEVADGAIGTVALAAGAVTNPKIGAGAVDTAELAADAVDSSKFDETDNYAFTGTVKRNGVDLADQNYAGPAHAWKKGVKAVRSAALPAFTPSGSPAGDILTADANGAFAVPGYTPVLNDRILVVGETAALKIHNGLRKLTQIGDVSNPFILTRTDDANVDAEVTLGMIVHDSNLGKFHFLSEFDGTLGTDDQGWEIREEGMTPQRTEDTGTGNAINIDLPSADTLGHEVYVGSVLQPATGVYTVGVGAGAGGVDRIEFDAPNAPDSGEAIDIVSFTRA